MNKKIIASVSLVAILVVGVIAGTITYYKPSTLHLVTALNIVEIENNSMNHGECSLR